MPDTAPARRMPLETDVYNQGAARRTIALIAATCFMFASVTAFFFFTTRQRSSEGAIESVEVVPLHTELRQGGTMAEGYGGGVLKSDELYVWVSVRMKNLTKDKPLFETHQRARLVMLDGTEQFTESESPIEVAKVRSLRQLPPVRGALLPRDLTLAPGASAEGLALFAYPVTKHDWEVRRMFSVNISFQYQHDLALKEPRPDR